MNFEIFSLPAVILLALAGAIIIVSYDWRLSLSALGLIFVGVFTLVALSWPLEMAVVKLVAGWISASVLGLSLLSLPPAESAPRVLYGSEIVFRFSSAGLVGLVAVSLAPGIVNLLDTSYEQALGGLLLLGLGILHLGFTTQPLKIILGLMTFLAGFEILYAAVESSVLVAGMMSVINMGIAFVGAYLLIAPTLEPEE